MFSHYYNAFWQITFDDEWDEKFDLDPFFPLDKVDKHVFEACLGYVGIKYLQMTYFIILQTWTAKVVGDIINYYADMK